MHCKFLHRRAALHLVIAVLCLGSSTVHPAGEDLKSLQDTLNVLNQEQQAVYQQFQMIQQLRRSNAEPVTPPIGGGPPGNYDEMVASKRAQAERDEAYARELRELYLRHRDIEREKQPLVQRLRQLRESAERARGG
ncbi:MAG: hypothetical protein ACT4PS_12605 [Betaproteobacteria bacterium]